MQRRTFMQLLAASPLVAALPEASQIPPYRVVTGYQPATQPGMPGPYPGRVVAVKSARCLNETGEQVNAEVVREMMTRGMRTLTGEQDVRAAWRRFFTPEDIVGIKVNVVGRPWVVSTPEIVAECVRNLLAIGLKPEQIYLYDRFRDQLDEANYAPHVPRGVQLFAAERRNESVDNHEYDPAVYVEASFFGEDDTRSNLMRLISGRLTKIINIPNMKDHGATGVTGCLKNIAYGGFSNVARTHQRGVSHTLSFVGTLANVEPVRSRTVLQVMDGLRGVWHAGPGARTRRYVFYPRQIMFGTDPVAIDRLLLDIIDDERKRRGAISIWDRSEQTLNFVNGRKRDRDPNVNILIREPLHIEYAAKLGLGIADARQIKVQEIEL